MNTIWKFEVDMASGRYLETPSRELGGFVVPVKMPPRAQIIHVALNRIRPLAGGDPKRGQGVAQGIFLWAYCPDANHDADVDREIAIMPTGVELGPEVRCSSGGFGGYLGTIHDGLLVWHIFEK